jgi:hypothetical protein
MSDHKDRELTNKELEGVTGGKSTAEPGGLHSAGNPTPLGRPVRIDADPEKADDPYRSAGRNKQ